MILQSKKEPSANRAALTRRLGWLGVLLPFLQLVPFSNATAQPVTDSLKALIMRNEKMYRNLSAMDDKGASYEFTNVTAWKIVDADLQDQIKKIYLAQYGEKQLKNFDIEDVYLFSAPVGNDRYEPFHVLFLGKRVSTDTAGDEGGFEFGGRRRSNNNERIPIAFKGRDVIRTMHRQPALLDNINAIQGEIVELPGDILPRGVQLVKNSAVRYVYHQMFEGFYSKRQIIDVQAAHGGLPTSDEFAADSTAELIINDPDQSAALPDETLNSMAFKYQRTVDLSIDHLNVNISRNNALELQLGDPEVGMPFWTSGQGRLWLNMKNQIGTESNFRIGIAFPANLGREDALTFNARKLSGFWGGSVDAYFAGIDFFSGFNMPVAFNFSVIPAGGSNPSIIYNGVNGATTVEGGHPIPDGRSFYRTAFIGQLYIPIIVQLDPANFIQLSAGVGAHTVKQSWIPDDSDVFYGRATQAMVGKVQDLIGPDGRQNASTPVTPHVAIQYVNHRSNKFGLNFQYDHLFTFGTWLELIPDHLRIEGSYTTPLVRDARPYEPNYFFEITPRIYF